MRDWSIRRTLLFVSILFAVLVVGGIALTTYVIVADGMQKVAHDTTQREAETAVAIIREAVTESELTVASKGTSSEDRVRLAMAALRERIPRVFEGAGLAGAEFALYDSGFSLVWASSPQALHPEYEARRRKTVQSGEPGQSFLGGGGPATGLFTASKLGVTTIHTPVRLPGRGSGVLDVTHLPTDEERVIDAVRFPMAALAVSAMLIMVLLMQTSMVWVLNLVNDLRKAADSIDSGRLDERLPQGGENEIGELARSINRLIERLKRRADAQARFVADASHELATPVAGIRGYTSILRAWGAEDPKVRGEAIEAIDRESKRMTRLTGDLLSLLHADQGLRLKSERFDVNALARERLAATASRYLDRGIEYEGPEDESIVVVGDMERLEDVMSILLDNASKYTPTGGVVALRTHRLREEVTIAVSDTGRGIPAEDIPRLFDRFYRSEQARADGEAGFGLGLAIAKSIVNSMGGTISVESELGEGTTFMVVVPRGRM